MDKELIFVILGTATITVGILGIFWCRLQFLKKALIPLLPLIQGEIATRFSLWSVTLKGIWQGERVEVELKIDLRKVTNFFITLYRQFPFRNLSILSENKKFVVVGFVSQFRTKLSEDELDANRPFKTNDEKIIKDFLTPRRRKNIHNILEEGFDIEVSGEYIKIWIAPFFRLNNRVVKPEFVNRMLKELLEFSK